MKLFKKASSKSASIQNEEKLRQETKTALTQLLQKVEEAYIITSEYGKRLQLSPSVTGCNFKDENLLPYPKVKITNALAFRAAFEQTFKDHWFGDPWVNYSQATLENHREGNMELARFVRKEVVAQMKESMDSMVELAWDRELNERIQQGEPLAIQEMKQLVEKCQFPNSNIPQDMAKLDKEFLVLLKDHMERFNSLRDSLPESRPN